MYTLYLLSFLLPALHVLARYHHFLPREIAAIGPSGTCPAAQITTTVELQPVYFSEYLPYNTVIDPFHDGHLVTVADAPTVLVIRTYITTIIGPGTTMVNPSSSGGQQPEDQGDGSDLTTTPVTSSDFLSPSLSDSLASSPTQVGPPELASSMTSFSGALSTSGVGATISPATTASSPFGTSPGSSVSSNMADLTVGQGLPDGLVTSLDSSSRIFLAMSTGGIAGRIGLERRQDDQATPTAMPVTIMNLDVTASSVPELPNIAVQDNCDSSTPFILSNGLLVSQIGVIGKIPGDTDAQFGVLIDAPSDQVNTTFDLLNGYLQWTTGDVGGANFYLCDGILYAGFPAVADPTCVLVQVGAIAAMACVERVQATRIVDPTFTAAITASDGSATPGNTAGSSTGSSSSLSSTSGFSLTTSLGSSSSGLSTSASAPSSGLVVGPGLGSSSLTAPTASISSLPVCSAGVIPNLDIYFTTSDPVLGITVTVCSVSTSPTSSPAQVTGSVPTSQLTTTTSTGVSSLPLCAAGVIPNVGVYFTAFNPVLGVTATICSVSAASTSTGQMTSQSSMTTTTASGSLPVCATGVIPNVGIYFTAFDPILGATATLCSVSATPTSAGQVTATSQSSSMTTTSGSSIPICSPGVVPNLGAFLTALDPLLGVTVTICSVSATSTSGIPITASAQTTSQLATTTSITSSGIPLCSPGVVPNLGTFLTAFDPLLGVTVTVCSVSATSTTSATTSSTSARACVNTLPADCASLSAVNGLSLLVQVPLCSAALGTLGTGAAAVCLSTGSISLFTTGQSVVNCLNNSVVC